MADGAGGMRLPARSTRGNRMGQLMTEAKEEGDDEFWGQDAFKEEERDDEYVSEAEEADQFDSDFSESEDEEDGDEGEGDEPRRREALRPPGEVKRKKPPGALKPDAAPRALASLEGLVAGVEGGDGGAPARVRAPKVVAELTADQLRKSKRATVLESDVLRERAAAEAAARPKPKARKLVEERPLTQAEMLAEAVQTEQLNAASLARILAIEEESKKRAAVVKKTYSGPRLRFRSSRAGETLAFLHGATPLEGLAREPPPLPQRALCAATGRRARFRDPRTLLPYADADALRAIRAAAAQGTLAQLPYAPPPGPATWGEDDDAGGAGPASFAQPWQQAMQPVQAWGA